MPYGTSAVSHSFPYLVPIYLTLCFLTPYFFALILYFVNPHLSPVKYLVLILTINY